MEEESGLVCEDDGLKSRDVAGERTIVSVTGHRFERPIGRGRGITVGIVQSDRGDLKTVT
jgi:hypothetical protein